MSSLKDRPQLVWVIEPENKIRFRYKSEGGSHGGLCGKPNLTGKKTYPTLQLKNYYGRKKIFVRVSLYTEDKKEHVLEFKGNKYEGSKHIIQEPLKEDNTVVFKDIKILSKKKDEIEEILMEKKLSNLKDNMSPVVRTQFEKSYRKDVKERAKAILNSVRLNFEAYEVDKPDVPLCFLFSGVICNQKTASKGDLRICRLSQCTGSWKGNDEVILLCEKVQKDNIKIKFFETNENGMIIWEDYGIFSPIDVHYQVAIPFKTPPYKKNIEKTVNICLERNDEISEPREFTYKPDGPSSKKRKLEPYTYTDELLSENIESSESVSSMSVSSPECAASSNIPPTFNLLTNDSNLFDVKNETPSDLDEIQACLDFFDPNIFADGYPSPFENLLNLQSYDDDSDEVYMCNVEDNTKIFHESDVIDAPKNTKILMNHSIGGIDIDAGLKKLTLKDGNKSKPSECASDCLRGSLSNPQCKKIQRLLLKRDSYGNSLLHIAVLLNRNILPILKLSHGANVTNMLINIRNQMNQTALHLATDKNRREAVRILLKCGSNPNLKDLHGNNCYHLAAKNNFPGILKEINTFSRFPHEVCDFNDEGLTPLHIAIVQENRYLFDLMKIHITNINVMEKKAGKSLLHYAVDLDQAVASDDTINSHETLLIKLLEMDDIDVDAQDFEGNTALHIACARKNVEAVEQLLYYGADPCLRNFKKECDFFDLLKEFTELVSQGKVPSDLTEDMEIVQLILKKLKYGEEYNKKSNFCNSREFEGSAGTPCQITEKLSEYLDKDMKWKKLVPYFLESDMEASLSLSPSPTKALLRYIKKNAQDDYLERLKAVLEIVDLKDAIDIINE